MRIILDIFGIIQGPVIVEDGQMADIGKMDEFCMNNKEKRWR